jgi:hypothetical protein
LPLKIGKLATFAGVIGQLIIGKYCATYNVKTAVEEAGRRDRFDGEAQRRRAPERTQSFRVGESSLMPQR